MKKTVLFLLLFVSLNLNAYPNNYGSLTEAERQWYLQQLEETEAYFLNMLDDVDAKAWTHRPEEEEWTIAECAEHILKAEQGILAKIQQLLKEQQPQAKKQAEISSTEFILTTVMDRYNKKVKTIKPMEPSGVWSTKAEFIQTYRDAREGLRQFIKETQAPLHHYFTASPIGEVDLYQNLVILTAHTARHTQQIESIKARLGLQTLSMVFGAACKVNTPLAEREKVQEFFGEILYLQVEAHSNYDKVVFGDGSFIAFVYSDEAEKVLSYEQHLNSMWGVLQVPTYQYESIRQRLKAFGVKELYPDKDQQKYFYFHAPGGQVFRLERISSES